MVGPSGCGKSTLLNIIAGFEKPDQGGAFINGAPIEGPGQRRVLVFQESALFPWMNVIGNVIFPMRFVKNSPRRRWVSQAHALLETVGLSGFERAFVHELSGGMRQRAALARALAAAPDILLMDEPFGALDAMTREKMYEDFDRMITGRGVTVLLVTHNVREAVCLGDHVHIMSERPGRIVESFEITLPRPREINSQVVADPTREITSVLRDTHDATEPISAARQRRKERNS